VRHQRGCTEGYTQDLGFETMPPNPTTCPVLTTPPAGFWEAHRMARWIDRGSPAVALAEVGTASLDLAEFVSAELREGVKAYDERKRKTMERLSAMTEGLRIGGKGHG